jgi:hypothetical protein
VYLMRDQGMERGEWGILRFGVTDRKAMLQ